MHDAAILYPYGRSVVSFWRRGAAGEGGRAIGAKHGARRGARTPMRGSTVSLLDAENDEALLARTAEADAAAFEALYARYSRPAYSVAFGMLRDAVRAQEVTQDVFLAIWRGAREFD